MTEYEGIALEKVRNQFQRDLDSLIGDALAQMPMALADDVMRMVDDAYGYAIFSKKYETHLAVKRTNWGTEAKAGLPDFLSIDAQP